MAIKVKKSTIVECDICEREVLIEYYTVLEMAGHDWDVCEHCSESLELFLRFFTVTVGLLINFKFKETLLSHRIEGHG